MGSVAESPNSRARCRRCRQPIATGELRFSRAVYSGFGDGESATYYHARCAVEVDPRGLVAALARFRKLDPARAKLLADARATAGAIARASRPTARAARPRLVADRGGRPRVRVLIAGSAMAVGAATRDFFARVARDLTWASPRREYVFSPPSRDVVGAGVDDPTLPLLGGVLALRVSTSLSTALPRTLAAWREAGLAVPLVWLLGQHVGTPAVRDAREREVRALLDRAGFVGDDAPMLYANLVTPATVDALGHALDAHLADPSTKPAVLPRRPPKPTRRTAKRARATIPRRGKKPSD